MFHIDVCLYEIPINKKEKEANDGIEQQTNVSPQTCQDSLRISCHKLQRVEIVTLYANGCILQFDLSEEGCGCRGPEECSQSPGFILSGGIPSM